MNAVEEILENKAINAWARHFSRSSAEVNKPHETDAELVRAEGGSPLLAITIDTVAEEIARGVYRNPFTMGWVTIMANFSDLAAVGARPLGIVISVSLPADKPSSFRDAVAQGMEAACRTLGVFVLGGDTNEAGEVSLTGCALGYVPGQRRLARIGSQPGDVVFLSGAAGRGNALGLRVLAGMPEEYFPEASFRPTARLLEGELVREFGTSCMDTSDGLLITLDQLLRLNRRGFRIEVDWHKVLAPDVSQFCRRVGIPDWFMAAGIHGEFELVFTIPAPAVASFLSGAEKMGFRPIRLGVVLDRPDFEVVLPNGVSAMIDMAPLRNLWAAGETSLKRLLEEHHAWGRIWGLES